jgi:hypothetical protein
MVGAGGFEPPTSSVSGTIEAIALPAETVKAQVGHYLTRAPGAPGDMGRRVPRCQFAAGFRYFVPQFVPWGGLGM